MCIQLHFEAHTSVATAHIAEALLGGIEAEVNKIEGLVLNELMTNEGGTNGQFAALRLNDLKSGMAQALEDTMAGGSPPCLDASAYRNAFARDMFAGQEVAFGRKGPTGSGIKKALQIAIATITGKDIEHILTRFVGRWNISPDAFQRADADLLMGGGIDTL